jgi:hypothetical protein
MQGVLATGLGFFLLGGVEAHFLNVSGILVNMVSMQLRSQLQCSLLRMY